MSDFFSALISESKQLTALEILAVISALIYVYFAAKEKAICFLFGFISSSIYIYICIKHKLYFDTFINAYYIVISVVGWIKWTGIQNATALKIKSISRKKFLILSAIGVFITLLLGFLANKFTDASIPYLDSFTTVFALIATWMVVKKQIENWLIWIVVDAASIGMYYYKELYFTSLLFLIYTIIAVRGYYLWKRKIHLVQNK